MVASNALQISRTELNGTNTISAGGTEAVMHSIQPHSIISLFAEIEIIIDHIFYVPD